MSIISVVRTKKGQVYFTTFLEDIFQATSIKT